MMVIPQNPTKTPLCNTCPLLFHLLLIFLFCPPCPPNLSHLSIPPYRFDWGRPRLFARATDLLPRSAVCFLFSSHSLSPPSQVPYSHCLCVSPPAPHLQVGFPLTQTSFFRTPPRNFSPPPSPHVFFYIRPEHTKELTPSSATPGPSTQVCTLPKFSSFSALQSHVYDATHLSSSPSR